MKKLLIIILLLFVLEVSAERQSAIYDDKIRVELVRYDPSPLSPGQITKGWFDVINVDDINLENIKFQVEEKFPILIKGDRIFDLDYFIIGERKSFYIELMIDPSVGEGNYSLGLSYTSAKSITKVNEFDLEVRKPSLAITPTKISVEPERINPGGEAIIILNCTSSWDFTLEDISIILDLKDQPFAPTGGTAEKTINKLDIKDQEEVQFRIIVDANADTKIYKVPLIIKYKDETGQEYEKIDNIGLIIDTEPEFQINLENSDIYKTGMNGKITISLSNIAPTDVKFVSIDLLESEYYEILSNKREYIGNLESDDYETVEFKIYVDKIKEDHLVPLYFLIDYKDAYNNNKEFTEEIKLNIYSRWDSIVYGLEKPNTTYLKIILSVLFVLFGWGVYQEWKNTKNFWSALGNTFAKIFRSLFINPWKK